MKREKNLKTNRMISKTILTISIFLLIFSIVIVIFNFSKDTNEYYITGFLSTVFFMISSYDLKATKKFEKELSEKLHDLNGKKVFFLLKNEETDRMIVDYLKDLLFNKGFENIVVINCYLIFKSAHYLNKLDCYEGHINIIEARYPGDKR